MKMQKLSVVSGQWSVASGKWSVVPSHQPSVAGHALPSTDHCPLTTGRRRGISLMEVLVSIGIVAIGLVSILSLLPVAGYQAGRAEEEERKSVLGLNAVQDLKNRGVFDTKNWVWYDSINDRWVGYEAVAVPTADFMPPLVIDPFMVAVATNQSQYRTIENFPANLVSSGGTTFQPTPTSPTPPPHFLHWLGMKRYTLAQATIFDSANSKFIPNGPLAQALCVSHDDTFATRPDDASLPAESPYTLDAANNPLKRDYEGLYSWLITLTPTELEFDHIETQPKRQYLMSLVIFSRRLSAIPTGDGTQEEAVYARFAPGNTGLGGGDFILADNTAQAETKLELARSGNWMMLCRFEPTGGNPPVWPVFNWYRIVAASETDDQTIRVEDITGSPQTMRGRNVTLSGPDWQSAIWPPASGWPTQIPTQFQNYDTYACLFDDIVAVYQRPIWLEGPSVWAQ